MAHEDAIRELVVAVAAAVVALALVLWRLNAVARVRAALAELDGLTARDDGEVL